jgi:hypothetical protein
MCRPIMDDGDAQSSFRRDNERPIGALARLSAIECAYAKDAHLHGLLDRAFEQSRRMERMTVCRSDKCMPRSGFVSFGTVN